MYDEEEMTINKISISIIALIFALLVIPTAIGQELPYPEEKREFSDHPPLKPIIILGTDFEPETKVCSVIQGRVRSVTHVDENGNLAMIAPSEGLHESEIGRNMEIHIFKDDQWKRIDSFNIEDPGQEHYINIEFGENGNITKQEMNRLLENIREEMDQLINSKEWDNVKNNNNQDENPDEDDHIPPEDENSDEDDQISPGTREMAVIVKREGDSWENAKRISGGPWYGTTRVSLIPNENYILVAYNEHTNDPLSSEQTKITMKRSVLSEEWMDTGPKLPEWLPDTEQSEETTGSHIWRQLEEGVRFVNEGFIRIPVYSEYPDKMEVELEADGYEPVTFGAVLQQDEKDTDTQQDEKDTDTTVYRIEGTPPVEGSYWTLESGETGELSIVDESGAMVDANISINGEEQGEGTVEYTPQGPLDIDASLDGETIIDTTLKLGEPEQVNDENGSGYFKYIVYGIIILIGGALIYYKKYENRTPGSSPPPSSKKLGE